MVANRCETKCSQSFVVKFNPTAVGRIDKVVEPVIFVVVNTATIFQTMFIIFGAKFVLVAVDDGATKEFSDTAGAIAQEADAFSGEVFAVLGNGVEQGDEPEINRGGIAISDHSVINKGWFELSFHLIFAEGFPIDLIEVGMCLGRHFGEGLMVAEVVKVAEVCSAVIAVVFPGFFDGGHIGLNRKFSINKGG